LNFPRSLARKRNCRFKLLFSIVSSSLTFRIQWHQSQLRIAGGSQSCPGTSYRIQQLAGHTGYPWACCPLRSATLQVKTPGNRTFMGARSPDAWYANSVSTFSSSSDPNFFAMAISAVASSAFRGRGNRLCCERYSESAWKPAWRVDGRSNLAKSVMKSSGDTRLSCSDFYAINGLI